MSELRCTHCGANELEPGVVTDNGTAADRTAGWVAGTVEPGGLLRGTACPSERDQWEVVAFCCSHCSHLELFAGQSLAER